MERIMLHNVEEQIRFKVLSTMKDGDKAFEASKVYQAVSHKLNDRRYGCECLAGVCNGYGDIELVIKIGGVRYLIEVIPSLVCLVYYEHESDYCSRPKRKTHYDVKVTRFGR